MGATGCDSASEINKGLFPSKAITDLDLEEYVGLFSCYKLHCRIGKSP
jgi:hypothetical protein